MMCVGRKIHFGQKHHFTRPLFELGFRSMDRKAVIIKGFSTLSLVIPLIYILYVLVIKPTYVNVPSEWNADKYWMFFSIRYWVRTLLIVSICTSIFSLVSFLVMYKNKTEKMPWIVFQLFSPFCAIISVVVCILIHCSGILRI